MMTEVIITFYLHSNKKYSKQIKHNRTKTESLELVPGINLEGGGGSII